MTSSYKKYDVIIVKFPFASSAAYKARSAVIVSTDYYNQHSRNAVLVLAISSQVSTKLDFEVEVIHWQEAGLLRPSIFKASIATIDQRAILATLRTLKQTDRENLDQLLQKIIG